MKIIRYLSAAFIGECLFIIFIALLNYTSIILLETIFLKASYGIGAVAIVLVVAVVLARNIRGFIYHISGAQKVGDCIFLFEAVSLRIRLEFWLILMFILFIITLLSLKVLAGAVN